MARACSVGEAEPSAEVFDACTATAARSAVAPRALLPRVRALPHLPPACSRCGRAPRRDQGELVKPCMMTDPIADMLTRIRNAALARHELTRMPASKLKQRIAEILKAEGYIADVREDEWGPKKHRDAHDRAQVRPRPHVRDRRHPPRLAPRPPRLRPPRPDPARALRPRHLDPEHVARPDDRQGSAPPQGRRRAPLRGVVMSTRSASSRPRRKQSRVGKRPIAAAEGRHRRRQRTARSTCKGPKGKLSRAICRRRSSVKHDGDARQRRRARRRAATRARLQGLARALIAEHGEGRRRRLRADARARRHRLPRRGEGQDAALSRSASRTRSSFPLPAGITRDDPAGLEGHASSS